MRTVNKFTCLGYCAVDPERIARDDKTWCKLVVTTNSGTQENRKADHHRVSVFDEYKAKFVLDYIKKGSIVYLEGELRSRKDDEGKTWWSIVCGEYNSRIELCEKKGDGGTTKSVADDDAPPF